IACIPVATRAGRGGSSRPKLIPEYALILPARPARLILSGPNASLPCRTHLFDVSRPWCLRAAPVGPWAAARGPNAFSTATGRPAVVAPVGAGRQGSDDGDAAARGRRIRSRPRWPAEPPGSVQLTGVPDGVRACRRAGRPAGSGTLAASVGLLAADSVVGFGKAPPPPGARFQPWTNRGSTVDCPWTGAREARPLPEAAAVPHHRAEAKGPLLTQVNLRRQRRHPALKRGRPARVHVVLSVRRHMPPGPQQEPRRDLVRGLTKRQLVVDLIGEDVIAHRAPLPRHPLALALRLRLRLVLAHADSFRTHSGGPLPAPALAPAAAALSTYQRRCTPGSARPAAPAPAPTHRSGSNA